MISVGRTPVQRKCNGSVDGNAAPSETLSETLSDIHGNVDGNVTETLPAETKWKRPDESLQGPLKRIVVARQRMRVSIQVESWQPGREGQEQGPDIPGCTSPMISRRDNRGKSPAFPVHRGPSENEVEVPLRFRHLLNFHVPYIP